MLLTTEPFSHEEKATRQNEPFLASKDLLGGVPWDNALEGRTLVYI